MKLEKLVTYQLTLTEAQVSALIELIESDKRVVSPAQEEALNAVHALLFSYGEVAA